MKRLLLTSASLLALMAAGSAASETTTFMYSGSVVDFPIPATGAYQITAYGAQGGGSGLIGAVGGGGAAIQGDFVLTAGEVLQIVVGGVGQTTASSGGGGGAAL